MPKRVASYIESSIHYVRPCKLSTTCSRRKLHTGFWDHGGTSQTLPLWWEAMVIPFSQKSTRQVVYGKDTTDFRGSADSTILEFLYPAKTLALLVKLSTYRLDRLDRLAQRCNSFNTRRFTSSLSLNTESQNPGLSNLQKTSDSTTNVSTTPEQLDHISDNSQWTNRSEMKLFYDMRWLSQMDVYETEKAREDLSPRENLIQKLQVPIPDSVDDTCWDDIWNLYNSLDERDQDFELTRRLMAFMSFSSRENERLRLIQLVQRQEFPEPWNFWKAVLLTSCAGKHDRAMEFHNLALSHGVITEAGSDLILAHAIWNGDWEVAKETFSKATASIIGNANEEYALSLFSKVWKLITWLPDLASIAADFLEESKLQPGNIKDAFTFQLILLTLAYGTNIDSLNRLLPLLRFYSIETSPLYETTLQRILDMFKRNPESLNVTNLGIVRSIWSSYRIFCKTGDIGQPLIHNLLSILTNAKTSNLTWEAEERRLITDILSVCANQNITLPYSLMVNLMSMYARHGNIEAVNLLEENLEPKLQDLNNIPRAKDEKSSDLTRLNALLKVHQVHGNPTNVRSEFDAIAAQYPRAIKFRSLWHKVIRSFTRSGNFPKAFQTALVDMPNAGILPNRSTILLLLWICGWSTDTTAVLTVLNIAEKQNVTLDEWMVRRLIHAHLKSHPSALAEEFDQVFASHQINRETWSKEAMAALMNEILTMIANRRDLRSANRIYNRMVEENLPIRRSTYWAIICLLTNLYQTDEAAHLIQNIMPSKGIRPQTTFYSRLMRGYCIEERWESVIRVQEEMKRRGILEDVMCRQKYLLARAMIDRRDPLQDSHILSLLRDSIYESKVLWLREEPVIWHRHYTDTYFSVLLDAYADIHANEMVQAITNLYWDAQKYLGQSDDPPLGIIRAFMKTALNSGEHTIIAEYWTKSLGILGEYVKEMATTLARISDIASTGSMRNVNDHAEDDITEPSFQKSQEDPLLPGERTHSQIDDIERARTSENSPASQISVAHLISKPLMMYISSLSMQENYQAIIETVRDVQKSGFVLTNQAWNHYVQVLSLSSEPTYILAAFRAAEIHLMPNYIPFIPTIPDKQHRQAMIHRQRRAQASNFQLYLDPGTLRVLKEIHLSAQFATVAGTDVGIVSDTNVRLSTAIDSVAPAVTNALKAWEHPKSTKHKLTPRHWRNAQSDMQKRRKSGISSSVAPNTNTGSVDLFSGFAVTPRNKTYHDSVYKFSSLFDDMSIVGTMDEYNQLDTAKKRPSAQKGMSAWRWPYQPQSDRTPIQSTSSALGDRQATSEAHEESPSIPSSNHLDLQVDPSGTIDNRQTPPAPDKPTVIGGLAHLLARTYDAHVDSNKKQPIRAREVLELLMHDLPPDTEQALPSKLEEARMISSTPAVTGLFGRSDRADSKKDGEGSPSKAGTGKGKKLGSNTAALQNLAQRAQ
jgi:pentatricopeptide repeat-containing protein PET309